MPFDQWTRRDVASLFGSIAIAWPHATRAQQSERVRRIGVVIINSESDAEGQERVSAFRKGLRDLGWVEGRNIQIEYRWGAGDPDRARAYVADLVALSLECVLVNGTPALSALQRATKKIPVVFVMVTDPVGAGYVESLAAPGANITGFSTFEPEIGGKWLELLHEISPGIQRVAGLLDPAFKGFAAVWRAVEQSASRMGIETTSLTFHDPAGDVGSSIAAFAQGSPGGLIVLPTSTNSVARDRIFSAVARVRMPAVYPFRFFATDGGLMAYGFNPPDLFLRSATYVNRILKGEKPADLPVQAPTKYELAINLKTANAFGMTVPPSLLAIADDVIE